MKIKDTIIQFMKFGIVGAINTVLSYAITNTGYYLLNMHEQVCNIVAFFITVFISFLLNGRFVFNNKDKKTNFWKALMKVYLLVCF